MGAPSSLSVAASAHSNLPQRIDMVKDHDDDDYYDDPDDHDDDLDDDD